MTRWLVAGVGNIFLGDDGFGVEVARRLADEDLPSWVQVADYGISGMHLAYDLADGYDTAILVDTTQRGDPPGTLTVIDAGQARQHAPAAGAVTGSGLFDAHGMQPDVVLGVLDMLGAGSARVLVVGCEPASLDYGMTLSEPVARAVDEAVQVVRRLIADSGNDIGRDGSTPPRAKGRGGVLEEERQASPPRAEGRGGVLEEERPASLRATERRGKDTASQAPRRRAGISTASAGATGEGHRLQAPGGERD